MYSWQRRRKKAPFVGTAVSLFASFACQAVLPSPVNGFPPATHTLCSLPDKVLKYIQAAEMFPLYLHATRLMAVDLAHILYVTNKSRTLKDKTTSIVLTSHNEMYLL